MMRARHMLKLLVVVASMMAWLTATNHCLVAMPAAHHSVDEQGMPAGCTMHAKERQSPAPGKNNPCGDLLCCKRLKAAQPLMAKHVANPLWLGLFVTFFTPSIDQAHASEALTSHFFDTGPPGERTFAELVLQRSILAHAPPALG